jgi:hypothetical protein
LGPLTDRAFAILKEAKKLGCDEFIFSGARPRRPLSNMAMTMLMRRMKIAGVSRRGSRVGGSAAAKLRPCLHQLPASRKRVAAAVGLFGFVSDRMRQRRFCRLARE